MRLKVHTFYKTKESTPGGYFYITSITTNSVCFVITQMPCTDEVSQYGGRYKLNKADFVNLIM